MTRVSQYLLVADDLFAMFNDTPEARKLIEYIASRVPHHIAISLGGIFFFETMSLLISIPTNSCEQKSKFLRMLR